uniref:Uncharacterized protein n=1 Tax=Arion vulgaris TaxID=1028688 RepID=A0A0B7AAT8_9EUPU
MLRKATLVIRKTSLPAVKTINQSRDAMTMPEFKVGERKNKKILDKFASFRLI